MCPYHTSYTLHDVYLQCQWENNAYSRNQGCIHDEIDTEIVYLYDEETDTATIQSTTEYANIRNGADGEYRFFLEHYTNVKELEYPNDHKLFSTMMVREMTCFVIF